MNCFQILNPNYALENLLRPKIAACIRQAQQPYLSIENCCKYKLCKCFSNSPNGLLCRFW